MQFRQFCNNVGYGIQKNAPYILFGVGILSLGGAIYATVKGSFKTSEILDDYDKEKKERELLLENELEDGASDEDKTMLQASCDDDIRSLKKKTAVKVAKSYIPAGALVTLSVTSFGFSVGMLNKRYLGVSAALTGVTEAFEAYRSRVIEAEGEIRDKEYYYGVKEEKIDIKEINSETGKEKNLKKTLLTGTPSGQFSYHFEKYSPETEMGFTQWDETSLYGKTYLESIIADSQRKLEIGKRVLLPNLLKELGAGDNVIKKEDMLAGWKPGDTISWGVEDDKFKDVYDFIYGYSNEVTLRFNCRPNVFE